MAQINMMDITAIYFEDTLYCMECWGDSELQTWNLKLDEVFTKDHVEKSEDWHFCDECKKRI
jgi:hypothetical protein